ncbi:MAG: PH domain-containing protein [Candidatus Nealsonbacteria bacterium]|nr:PH domain-containing protein [Candidatus Nealsonbacteria bacterium]
MAETTDATIPEFDDAPVMTVWPTIGATAAGRLVGQLSAVPIGVGEFFTLGKLLALASIPISLSVFAWQLLPFVCRRYSITTRRLIIRKGYSEIDEKSIDLDGFDAIDVEVLAGQQWLYAGELIFRRDGHEEFRFSGVSRPEVFRQACLKAQDALLSVRAVLKQQAQPAAT